MPHLIFRPRSRFFLVTGRTGVGDRIFVGHLRRDKTEGVRVYEGARNALGLDGGHVTCDAFAARAASLMVRVLLDG